jgi:DNA-binding transcriptional regulator YiaG
MARPNKGALVAQDEQSAQLGRLHRALRERRGMTLQTYSHLLGCCAMTVRAHEAGTRMLRADQIVQAARVLRVKPRKLIETGE